MNINCTVIIQICNFFVTWLLLEKILLKPLFQRLTEKSRSESDFLASIENMRQDIAQLDQRHREQWQVFNKYCSQNIPISKGFTSPHEQAFKSLDQEIDLDSVDSLAQDYAAHIVHWLREIQ